MTLPSQDPHDRSRWVWWRTWVLIIIFNKTDTTCLQVKVSMLAYMGGVSSYFCMSQASCFWCHKYHVKCTSKQCNLNRLKSGSKKDTNETSTCVVPAHASQTNACLSGEKRGTTKALLYTWPRRVGVGCCGC